jgi:hypothetical protein
MADLDLDALERHYAGSYDFDGKTLALLSRLRAAEARVAELEEYKAKAQPAALDQAVEIIALRAVADAARALRANDGSHGRWHALEYAAAGERLDAALDALDAAKAPSSDRESVPPEVHERGWQWRPVSGDTAFAPPFGTVRACADCGCLVAGGPSRCGQCAKGGSP